MLAGRSERTSQRRGYLLFFERGYGVLVFERFLTQPDSIRIQVPTSSVDFLIVSLVKLQGSLI